MSTNNYQKWGIEDSEKVGIRHLKFAFWGASGSRKTETVLRYFPNVLLIDTEGNSDQCLKDPEIPRFIRVKTKDPRKALEIMEAAARGQITMPNGEPVKTISIDSGSLLWAIQQDAFVNVAENRSRKYNKSAEEANMTMSDWTKAKRPLRSIMTAFNGSPIPFLVMILREKDLWRDKGGGEMEKAGVTYDFIKNIEYEFSAFLHFKKEGGWSMEVDSVKGMLRNILPLGKNLKTFPIQEILEYAQSLQTSGSPEEEDDHQLAESIAKGEEAGQYPRTSQGLLKYAREIKNMSPSEVGQVLKAGGITGFDSVKWNQMIALINAVEPELPEN